MTVASRMLIRNADKPVRPGPIIAAHAESPRPAHPFVSGGADLLGRFELDQLLPHDSHRVADQIDTFTSTERLQQLGHGRLRQDHR